MDLNLKNHIAVVTGGASGIGRAIAKGFAIEGARVAIWDVADDVASVASEVDSDAAGEVMGFVVDVTNREAIVRAMRETESRLGPLDHLVHCAAVGSGKFGFPFTNLQPTDWPRVLDVNIMGMVNVAHTVAPGMIKRGAGTMLFIASVAGQTGSSTDPPYSAAKAANINFAQCMAKDLAPYGIRVNTLCPGMVQTPLSRAVWQAWYDQQPPDHKQSYEDWTAAKVRALVPLGKRQQPDDIADMAIFLSSDRSAHVTGQSINVDGGYVMHS